MNRQIRRVSVFVGILMLAVILNLNWVQVLHGTSYRDNAANQRVALDDYKRQRGSIVLQGSGTAISESVVTKDALTYLRTYQNGPLYATVTGFNSILYGNTEIESAEDSVLSGNDDRFFVQRLTNLLTGRDPRGGNVLLTINKQAQTAAYQALGGRRGAVVALDPATGAVLAAVSTPSYDPAKLSSHSTTGIKKAWNAYLNDKDNPLSNRAFTETYPPGSVFKVIVSAAALKAGKSPSSVIAAPNALTLPGTSTQLRNFAGEQCANGSTDTLIHALTISCNTAFAQLGMDLGTSRVRSEADLFGINDSDFTIPVRVAGSTIGPVVDKAALAQTSIGQRDVRITPLQAAMISAAVANQGTLLTPYLVAEEQGPNLATLSKATPQILSQPLSPSQADQLTTMMESVVQSAQGTGQAAQIPGITVAGKTGTADNGPQKADGTYINPPHAWFSGFAPAARPRIAVAVFLENGGVAGNETTGGLAAAPVAKQVMQAYLSSIGVKGN
ncbi:penicillin-binding protein 2 [Jatrophihabitans telluris]|uniref:Penicillin-binding protein 2 n=1 Tax=Jatrophihabitans telluris TaxID=2038343 RepID=A0ABY4QY69_9ACTN|nr:penicillin-binding protein 2 [Jatrophihabitans telluris]UQX88631.1 penicillin-binding protein 2 [Jatrophihabitans telluris]